MSEFVINNKNQKDDTLSVKAYTFWGMHETEDSQGFPMLDLQDDDDIFTIPNVYAAEVSKGAKTTYYVKRGKYGKLYDPIGMYSEGTQKNQMRHAGKPEWSLQTTSKLVFDQYTKYLKTKNSAWLNNAEREVV